MIVAYIISIHYIVVTSGCPVSPGTSAEELCSNSITSVKALAQPPMQQYEQYLRACYRVQPGLQRCKWFRMPGRKCFNLALIERKEVTRSEADEFTLTTLHDSTDDIFRAKLPVNPSEILKSDETGLKVNRVFVEGSPGVGKSTLAMDYCKLWDEGSALSEFKLVILLRLQDQSIQEAESLCDLFYHPDPSVQLKVTQQIVEEEGEGVLLILDGIDQLVQPFRRHEALMDILRGSRLRRVSLIVTSRSSATRKLLSKCPLRFDRRVELLGFSEEEIEQHAESALGSSPSFLNAFHMEYLANNPFLRNVMRIPLHTAVIVEAYKEANDSKKTLPQTMTDLYETILRYLLRHYMLLSGAKGSVENLSRLPRSVEQPLRVMTQLAFNGITRQEFVFFKLPKSCQHLGLMTATPKLYLGKVTEPSYSFFHHGLQEYLAALHISKLSNTEQGRILDEYWGQPHFDSTWQFLAGISTSKCALWKKIRSEMSLDDKVSTPVFRCLYEAHRKTPCEVALGRPRLEYPPVQYGYDVLPMHCYMLGCCMAHSSCTLSLRLRLGTKHLQALSTGLQTTMSTVASLETLFLLPPITGNTLQWLCEMPPSVIRELDVSHSNLTKEILDMIAVIVPSLVNLKKIDVRGNALGNGGLVRLFSSLVRFNSLHSLNVINTGIGPLDLAVLTRLIAPNKSLRQLKIGDENMSAESTSQVSHLIYAPSSLESVHIWSSNLIPEMSSIARLLSKNANLTGLEFHGCLIGNQGSQELANALRVNKRVQHLIVSMFEVPTPFQTGSEGAHAFADMLRVNRVLKHFEISFDRSLGRDGALALANALRRNSTLQFFKIPQNYFSHDEVLSIDPRVVWS